MREEEDEGLEMQPGSPKSFFRSIVPCLGLPFHSAR